MAVLRNNGGSYGALKSVQRNTGGTWKPAKAVWRNVGGTWRTVWNSRTISIQIASHVQRQVGFGGNPQYRDEVTLRVFVSDGAAPSSYLWGGAAPGQSATTVFYGSNYQPNGFTFQDYADVSVNVVIAGEPYAADIRFQYTSGGLA